MVESKMTVSSGNLRDQKVDSRICGGDGMIGMFTPEEGKLLIVVVVEFVLHRPSLTLNRDDSRGSSAS